MSSVFYNSYFRDELNNSVDLKNDDIYIMLVTSTYTPDIDNHTKRSDVTNEVVGTGYVSGGKVLANKVFTVDNSNNLGKFTADAITWSSSTITARGAVLYKHRGGAASADELICYYDFGSDQTSVAADFIVTPNASGLFTAKQG